MENRSILNVIFGIFVAIGLLSFMDKALSYNDGLDKYAETSTHQAINRYAVELFEQMFLNTSETDRYLNFNEKHPGCVSPARLQDERTLSPTSATGWNGFFHAPFPINHTRLRAKGLFAPSS